MGQILCITMEGYEFVAGLEMHVQLNTSTKAFCTDNNAFGGDPNKINNFLNDPKLNLSAHELLRNFSSKYTISNYIIYYYLNKDGDWHSNIRDNDNIWFSELTDLLEKNDISWIHYDVNTEFHEIEANSFEADNFSDTTLLDKFYVVTTIGGEFI